MNTVKQKLPVVELLAGLAEEASELAQAALKLRRVMDGRNPTPKTHEQAMMELTEEIADVKLYVSLLDVDPRAVSEIMKHKLMRWEERLMKQEEQKDG